ncbi:unnamed protein product [Phytophthora lilii]|uniref:Unnamed protein product n=1 Tax=Phytophthora lilii TaxID=2077276 RepID=A0A9W6XIX5_9STRA|nr:unnamed protein product [Phytophthora lilii]
MVNAVTAILEYAMHLVDDLHTEISVVLRFGYRQWVLGNDDDIEARLVSALVCALGHFDWLCIQFGLKNAPMIYQLMLDNALWDLSRPKGGWKHFAKVVRVAEARSQKTHRVVPATDPASGSISQSSRLVPTKFDAA